MRKKDHFILYFRIILILSLGSLISFQGMIISALAYILTCDIIRGDK